MLLLLYIAGMRCTFPETPQIALGKANRKLVSEGFYKIDGVSIKNITVKYRSEKVCLEYLYRILGNAFNRG